MRVVLRRAGHLHQWFQQELQLYMYNKQFYGVLITYGLSVLGGVVVVKSCSRGGEGGRTKMFEVGHDSFEVGAARFINIFLVLNRKPPYNCLFIFNWLIINSN